MLRELSRKAPRMERHFRGVLARCGFDRAQAGALLAVLPTAASALRKFNDRVQQEGRRLAKLNVSIDQVDTMLRRFDEMAAKSLAGRFAPAREQLLLATLHNLHAAFYQVREAEAQVFFGIYRAETGAADVDDLLRRFVGVLTRT